MNDIELIEAWECAECGSKRGRSEDSEYLCRECDCEHRDVEHHTCIDCGADRSVVYCEDEYER